MNNSIFKEQINTRKLKSQKRVSRFTLTPMMLLLISSLLYFFPYFVGSFDYIDIVGRYEHTYSTKTGYVVLLSLVSIIAAILLSPFKFKQDFEVRQNGSCYESSFLLCMLVALGAYTLATPELFLASKADVLEQTNRAHLSFYVLSSISIVFAFLAGIRRNKLVFVFGFLGLLLILYVGHRSSLAISLISVAYLQFRNKSLFSLKVRHIVSAVLVLSFLVMYKSVYVPIKTGDLYLIKHKIQSDVLLESTKIGLEQFLIFSQLDFVVSNDYSLECSNLKLIPVSFVPFMDSVFDYNKCDYNSQIQNTFFPAYAGGVGANIWAEFYANFGYVGIPTLVFIIWLSCFVLEKAICVVQSAILKAGLIVGIINLTFYIQRKDLLGAFISAKRAVIISFLIFFLAYIIRIGSQKNNRCH